MKDILRSDGPKLNIFFDFVSNLNEKVDDFLKKETCVRVTDIPDQLFNSLSVATDFLEKAVDRIVKTNYSHNKYSIVAGVDFQRTARSGFNDSTFAEYYKVKYNAKLSHFDAPLATLIVAKEDAVSEEVLWKKSQKFPKSYSLFHSNLTLLSRNKQFIKEVYLRIPLSNEVAEKHPLIPIEFIKFVPFPRMCGMLFQYLDPLFKQTAPFFSGRQPVTEVVTECKKHIEKVCKYSFINLNFLQAVLTPQSFPLKFNPIFENYERIEFLGDAVLDVLITFSIFNSSPNANEEKMTEAKFILVSNNSFCKMCFLIELNKFIMMSHIEKAKENHKVFADVFEALFGAMFLDSGVLRCAEAFKKIVTDHSSQLKMLAGRNKVADSALSYICETQDITRLIFKATPIDNHPLSLGLLRHLIHLNFTETDLPIFRQALTHSSMTHIVSYERLEFVGDIVVKFGSAIFLFYSFPSANEDGLSTSISSYKSNDFLGRAAFKLRFHDYLLYRDSLRDQMTLTLETVKNKFFPVPKVYGDILESMMAAITITKGLKIAINYYGEYVLEDKWSNRASSATKHLKSQVLELIAKTIPMCTHDWIYWVEDQKFLSTMSINDIRIPLLGESKDKLKAAEALCSEIMQKVESDPNYLIKLINQPIQEKPVIEEVFEFYDID